MWPSSSQISSDLRLHLPRLELQPAQLYDSVRLDSPREIRVLEILRYSDYPGAPLCGTLRAVDLQSSPNFAALSYVWGEFSVPKDVVWCNSTAVAVTKSCHEALCALRQRYSAFTIWVDAVCINQADEAEKAAQIPLMREIFTWAGAVYIWLGPGNDQTKRAMSRLSMISGPYMPGTPWITRDKRASMLIDEIQYTAHVIYQMKTWILVSIYALCSILFVLVERLVDYIRARLKKVPVTYRGTREVESEKLDWSDLDSLLSHDWTLRVWTFQEVILASNPIIICGQDTINWSQLYRGLHPNPVTMKAFVELDDSAASDLATTPSIVAWKHLFRLWLNATRPVTWNDIEYRKLPRAPSRAAEDWSVWDYCDKMVGSYSFWVLRAAVFSLARTIISTVASLLFVHYYYEYSACYWTILLAMIMVSTIPVAIYCSLRYRQTGKHRPGHPWVFVGVLRALRERRASVPKDKSFAMHGVFQGLGITLSKPNYKDHLGLVYQKLFTDLLRWNPAMINLLIDVGQTLPGSASWVPDWSNVHERMWLPSKYLYGTIENLDTSRTSEPASIFPVTVDGNRLIISGLKIGSLTFAHGLFQELDVQDHNDDGSSSTAEFKDTLQVLARWVTLLRRDVPRNATYDSVPGAIYDVLCGRIVDDPDQSANSFHECFRILCKKGSARGSVENSSADVCLEMLRDLQQKPVALLELVRLVNEMAGKRGIFFSADGHIGSGPTHAAEGDEILILRGVAVPMIARRQQGDTEGAPVYTLLGPAFVRGYMGLLDFDPASSASEWQELAFI